MNFILLRSCKLVQNGKNSRSNIKIHNIYISYALSINDLQSQNTVTVESLWEENMLFDAVQATFKKIFFHSHSIIIFSQHEKLKTWSMGGWL